MSNDDTSTHDGKFHTNPEDSSRTDTHSISILFSFFFSHSKFQSRAHSNCSPLLPANTHRDRERVKQEWKWSAKQRSRISSGSSRSSYNQTIGISRIKIEIVCAPSNAKQKSLWSCTQKKTYTCDGCACACLCAYVYARMSARNDRTSHILYIKYCVRAQIFETVFCLHWINHPHTSTNWYAEAATTTTLTDGKCKSRCRMEGKEWVPFYCKSRAHQFECTFACFAWFCCCGYGTRRRKNKSMKSESVRASTFKNFYLQSCAFSNTNETKADKALTEIWIRLTNSSVCQFSNVFNWSI